MTARDVLREAANRGVLIERNGSALRVRGPSKAVTELQARIVAMKPDIIAILDEGAELAPDSHSYVASNGIDRNARQFGVCIACGVPWEFHGRPAFAAWLLTDDANSVALNRASAVVATAVAQAIGGDS